MRGQSGHDTCPHVKSTPSVLGLNSWMTSQLNEALIPKLYVGHSCVWLFFDILFMDVCTTRQWQTSGRLVQELNACIVDLMYRWALTIMKEIV